MKAAASEGREVDQDVSRSYRRPSLCRIAVLAAAGSLGYFGLLGGDYTAITGGRVCEKGNDHGTRSKGYNGSEGNAGLQADIESDTGSKEDQGTGVMMRVLSWNPSSIVTEGRAEDLSRDLPNFDFLLLQGTTTSSRGRDHYLLPHQPQGVLGGLATRTTRHEELWLQYFRSQQIRPEQNQNDLAAAERGAGARNLDANQRQGERLDDWGLPLSIATEDEKAHGGAVRKVLMIGTDLNDGFGLTRPHRRPPLLKRISSSLKPNRGR